MLRWRDIPLGVAGALAVLVGPAPADVVGLFEAPAPPCVAANGCGHTNAWWDRAVLVAHAAEPGARGQHRRLYNSFTMPGTGTAGGGAGAGAGGRITASK